MNQFSLHPNVYATGNCPNLLGMLEQTWVSNHNSGDGTMYLLSGFANYNGGVRFYSHFADHIENGGRIVAFFGGSTSQRLSSKQCVEAFLGCGADVHVINRKNIFHAKCYGTQSSTGQSLIVTSGNFTSRGLSQNVEACVMLDNSFLQSSGFSWQVLSDSIFNQKWDLYQPNLNMPDEPAWQLLYDESYGVAPLLEESYQITLLITLGHSDTARIQAYPGTDASKGSQYFWLSKDCFDFFPPLTIKNRRGWKGTYSCIVTLHYLDIDATDYKCRVTYEADNNRDFRLGTGLLRYTKAATRGDLAAISRVGEDEYTLKFFFQGTNEFDVLIPYATTFIGHQGKKYGFISNDVFENLTGILPETPHP